MRGRLVIRTVPRPAAAKTGATISTPFTVPSGTAANAVYGNRYQAFKSFPDGGVAYPSAGTPSTKLKVLRIMPCGVTL
jgi:hypothetical protein